MKVLYALLSALITSATPAKSDFVGRLVLEPDGCMDGENCIVAENFGYIDKRNVGWMSSAGNITDGASIPRWAQMFVGIPFTEEYLPAAILHDHYSKSGRPVRGWFETQRMFYEVLLESGVPEPRASVLYAGVLIGSGKWIKVLEGNKQCDFAVNCVFNDNEIVESFIMEEESYGSPKYLRIFETMRAKIENGSFLGTDAVEDLAKQNYPDNIFLGNSRGIIVLIKPDNTGLEDF